MVEPPLYCQQPPLRVILESRQLVLTDRTHISCKHFLTEESCSLHTRFCLINIIRCFSDEGGHRARMERKLCCSKTDNHRSGKPDFVESHEGLLAAQSGCSQDEHRFQLRIFLKESFLRKGWVLVRTCSSFQQIYECSTRFYLILSY